MRVMRSMRAGFVVLCAALSIGCSDSPTSPDPVAASEIDRLQIFVRESQNEYVEIDFRRSGGKSTLAIFRPSQPGIPRLLIDSIGPVTDDPAEIDQLLKHFNVWALADSNAAGAACNTKNGGWLCNPTFNDYSLAMAVTRRGDSRSQRYTRLGESSSNTTARALGDFILALSRKRAGGNSVVLPADSCSSTRPVFGIATATDRQLFSYNVNAPLNLQKTVELTANGVETSRISYSSPDGGLVTGMLWDPVTRSGPRPAMIVMHGLPGTARDFTGLGENYARNGAVVIAIDAPFSRRTGPQLTLTALDRIEQVQVIKDLQRAVDLLRAHPNVDDDRIAFMGFSWGGATGALFIGIERRLKAAVLVVGHGGQVSHATGPDGFKHIAFLPCANRVAWIRAMAPVEPVRFVGMANASLLLQNGMSDVLIPNADAAELHAAAPQGKDVRWYDGGHNLTPQAGTERYDWLHAKIGIDPRLTTQNDK